MASGVARQLALAANRRAVLLAVAAAVGVAVLVRVPFFFWPLLSDEGGYAYTAHWWFRGWELYGDDLWFDKPQGIFVAYRAGSLFLGEATWAIRLWGALWAAGTVVAVWLVGRRLFDERSALAAAFLQAIFAAHTHVEGFSANAEVFMVLPATLSAYFLLRREPARAGLFASAAIMLKPSGVSAVLLGVAWLAYSREAWGFWARFVVTSALLPAAAFAHGALTAGARQYLDAILFQRVDTPRPNQFGASLLGLVRTLTVWAPLAVLTRAGVSRAGRPWRAFLLMWLVASGAGVAIGGNWWAHYFIQIVPPLAVGAGAGLVFLWRSAGRGRVLLAALLVVPVLHAASFAVAGPAQGSYDLYGRRGYLVAEEAARYMRAHTDEDDLIYVAFAEADIYHLAERRSSLPYLFGLLVQSYPGVYPKLLASMEAREPKYVLLLNQPLESVDPDNEFMRLLDDGYEIETVFETGVEGSGGPVPLYVRR